MPAGYSGTPLLRKLGVKDEHVCLLLAAPDTVPEINELATRGGVKRVKTARGVTGGPYHFIHCFSADIDCLTTVLPKLKAVLQQNGMIWFSWPKKSSGVVSTITEDDIRRQALQIGLVDVKICAVNEVWSGLKLVIPLKARKT